MAEKTNDAILAEQLAAFAKQISELHAEAAKTYSEIKPVIAQVTEVVTAILIIDERRLLASAH